AAEQLRDPAYRARLSARLSAARGRRHTVACLICGSAFPLPPSRAKTQQRLACGPACAAEYDRRRPTRLPFDCAVCGGPATARGWRVLRQKRIMSGGACRRAFAAEVRRGVEVVCAVCGRPSLLIPPRARRPGARVCGPPCLKELQRRRGSARRPDP